MARPDDAHLRRLRDPSRHSREFPGHTRRHLEGWLELGHSSPLGVRWNSVSPGVVARQAMPIVEAVRCRQWRAPIFGALDVGMPEHAADEAKLAKPRPGAGLDYTSARLSVRSARSLIAGRTVANPDVAGRP